jgi:rhodanese-related sulfurtransferase
MTTQRAIARFANVHELLNDARTRLHRVTPDAAFVDVVAGEALIVDIRLDWQRAAEGEIPGSYIVDRNHLEWRLHPESDARLAVATTCQRWIVVCSEGYTSSLAADSLNSIGVAATDIVGGYHAWVGAGLPTQQTVTDNESQVGNN